MKNKTFLICLGILSLFVFKDAYAMPWDEGITNIKNALTGPVASSLSLIGLIAAGATLIFGGEISGFLKSLIYMVLVISLIVCGNAFITKIMGQDVKESSSGAAITYVIDVPDSHVYKIS